MFYRSLIRSALYRRRESRSSLVFCSLQKNLKNSHEEKLFLQIGNNLIYITEPQVCDDVSKWSFLVGSSLVCSSSLEKITFMIEATSQQKLHLSAAGTHKKLLKWSDYCHPLAHVPGHPFKAVAETSLENFARLGAAFMEDRLLMENDLIPEKIVSVSLSESTLKELIIRQQSNIDQKIKSILSPEKKRDVPRSSLSRKNSLHPSDRRDSDTRSFVAEPSDGRREEPDEPGSEHHHVDGHHHLHLSSCNECLQLENSTIMSVKFASVENIPDLPDDYVATDDEDETENVSSRTNKSGKPPNVLVFTAGCHERYRRVRSVLSECIDTDSYAIYPLDPDRVLNEPWTDNALLLVLADAQTVTTQLRQRFLSYMSRGGKVLGLSSTFCPAGLVLRPGDERKNRIRTLTFTKSDSTEVQLNVLSGGNSYAREPSDDGDGEVELWGEIDGGEEKEMVIVRVTSGDDGGEAVLCQVHLEMSPDAPDDLGSSGFSELKMSNARRYEVLTEILTSLGLSCELSQVPPQTPVYLLSTNQDQRNRFLYWLKGYVDGSGGFLQTQTGRFRVFWDGEKSSDLRDDEKEFHTEPPENFSEHFSLQTYKQNLQTRRLGQNVIYADVTTNTMNLLERMILNLPQEMGLIAIATRQTQGKGRGGNMWLSPLGSAMFTLHLQLPLNSPLGQRVSFLQHLVSLAVVESVRTLPGYEDIDLRLKWPNDIYYSNLIKVGGVLINSTVTSQTFHLLIGCGFNVSNSNPTVCINDLVLQQNRQNHISLDELSPALLIARSVTLLERFITDFQLHGPNKLLPLYYKRWIHSGKRVRLWREDGPEADVVGLDENGFLQVISDGDVVSVQPDGNSFDMLRNLVITKTS